MLEDLVDESVEVAVGQRHPVEAGVVRLRGDLGGALVTLVGYRLMVRIGRLPDEARIFGASAP